MNPGMASSLAQAGSKNALAWRVLSVGFLYPDAAWRERFRALLKAFREAKPGNESLWKALENSLQEFQNTLEMEHFKLFGSPAGCSYEMTIYLTESPFEAAKKLADIAGFYKAFGVEVNEKVDNLPALLEFLGYLEAKRAHAHDKDWKEKETITKDAIEKLWKTFMKPALTKFSLQLKNKTNCGFYHKLADISLKMGGAL